MDVEDSKEPATSGVNVQLVSRTVIELMRGGESKSTKLEDIDRIRVWSRGRSPSINASTLAATSAIDSLRR